MIIIIDIIIIIIINNNIIFFNAIHTNFIITIISFIILRLIIFSWAYSHCEIVGWGMQEYNNSDSYPDSVRGAQIQGKYS